MWPIIHIEEFETSLLTLFGVSLVLWRRKADNTLSNPCFRPSLLTSQHLHFQFPITSLLKIFVRSRRDWKKKMPGRIPTLPLFQSLRLRKPLPFFVPFCIVMPTHGERGVGGNFAGREGGNRKHEMMMWGWWWNDLLFTFILQRNFPRAWEEHILLLAFALLWDLCFTSFFLYEYCIWLLARLALGWETNWRKVLAGLDELLARKRKPKRFSKSFASNLCVWRKWADLKINCAKPLRLMKK